MKHTHVLVTYLMVFFAVAVHVPNVNCAEYETEYPSYDSKKYDYHHHQHEDYHPPAPKKHGGHVDINIPLDLGTLAKFGILGFTQLKLLMALGKVGMAGLGVSALGLGQLGKIGLSLAPVHKGAGIAIDVGPSHPQHHAKSRTGYERPHHESGEKRY